MRDIAAKVGIKAASIYNHFSSKTDLFKEIYAFYIQMKNQVFSDLEKLLPLVETEPVIDVLMKIEYYFDPSLHEKMNRIFFIASQRLCRDKENFIHNNFFEPLNEILHAILSRALTLGKIESVDIGSFVRVASFYAFSAAELNCTPMKVGLEEWRKGLFMIFSLLKPLHQKNNKKEASYGKGLTGPKASKKNIYKRGNTAAGK
jgi:AcrR family transcriptional regulator